MKKLRSAAFGLMLSTTLACGDDSNTTDAGTATESGGDGDDGDLLPPTCVLECEHPDDCAQAGAPPTLDADNYTCENGACVYQGCNVGECEEGSTCRSSAVGYSVCMLECSVPADCDTGAAHADPDNYTCEDSICIYTGCNSDEECQEGLDPDHACIDPGGGQGTCVPACSTAADCVEPDAQPAFDEDNFVCTNGGCFYNGCNSEAECDALGFGALEYTCQ